MLAEKGVPNLGTVSPTALAMETQLPHSGLVLTNELAAPGGCEMRRRGSWCAKERGTILAIFGMQPPFDGNND